MDTTLREHAALAEQIYLEKYAKSYERKFPGKSVGIDVGSKKAFVADGVLDILKMVANEDLDDIIFIKQIASKHPFGPWRRSLGTPELKDFLGNRISGYIIAPVSDPSKSSAIVKNMGDRRVAIPVWISRASAEAFIRELTSRPNQFEVIEVFHSDIDRSIRSKSGFWLSYCIVEMLP